METTKCGACPEAMERIESKVDLIHDHIVGGIGKEPGLDERVRRNSKGLRVIFGGLATLYATVVYWIFERLTI